METPLKTIGGTPLVGTAPLKYCPECGTEFKQVALAVKGGYVLHAKQCTKCGHLEDIQRVKTDN